MSNTHLILAAVAIGVLLLAVNYGPAALARLRRVKAASTTDAAWPDDKPAPDAFTTYLNALEAVGLAPPDTLSVARGGLCPNAAKVVKAVKG